MYAAVFGVRIKLPYAKGKKKGADPIQAALQEAAKQAASGAVQQMADIGATKTEEAIEESLSTGDVDSDAHGRCETDFSGAHDHDALLITIGTEYAKEFRIETPVIMVGAFPVRGFIEFGAAAGFEFTATELNGDGGFEIDNEGMTITREMMINKSTHSHTKKYGCGIPICNHTNAFHAKAGGHNNSMVTGDSITNKELKEKAAYAKKIDLESIQDEPTFLQVDTALRTKPEDFTSVAKKSQCADSPRVYVGKAKTAKECANLVAADTKIYAKLVTDKKYHHETCYYGQWKKPTLIGTFSSTAECARAYWRAKKKFCPGCKDEDIKKKVFYWYVKNPDHYYNGYYSDHSCYVNNDDKMCVSEDKKVNNYCDYLGKPMALYKSVQSVEWNYHDISCFDMTTGTGTFGSMRVHPFSIGEMDEKELKASLMYFTYSNSKHHKVCYREMPGVCQKDCDWNGLSDAQVKNENLMTSGVCADNGRVCVKGNGDQKDTWITGLKYAQAPYGDVCQTVHTANSGMGLYKTNIFKPSTNSTFYRPEPQLCAEEGVNFPFNGGTSPNPNPNPYHFE